MKILKQNIAPLYMLGGLIIVTMFVLTAKTASAQTPMTSNGVAAPPPPSSVVKQAEQQAKGNFTTMKRWTIGGQIQTKWDNAEKDAGVTAFELCTQCVYRVYTRERMVTNFELPEGEVIKKIDAGDVEAFTFEQRGKRRFTVRPKGFGVDTNLLVYGYSGTIYPIYVRAERFNSKNIPDMIVQIKGTVQVDTDKEQGLSVDGIGEFDNGSRPGRGLPPQPDLPIVSLDQADAEAHLKGQKQNDFVKEVPFDPTKLYGWGDFELSGDGPHAKELRDSIETIYRDDYMIYIRFKGNFELPVGYVVVDRIDELVNTRLKGNTFIIEVEEDRNLFSLKSGETYLCIKYVGVKPS